MSPLPLVTVLIPARNEATDIEGCLSAVAAQDYPVNRMEVIVVDGTSDDGTGEVARRALGRWGFGSTAVLTNETATTPSNLNVGLQRAAGTVLCRVDARTRIQPHYVRTCVDVLQERPEVAVVGGSQVAVARDRTAKALGIARALNNRYSMGGSPYRASTSSGQSDTVYLGAFRTSQVRSAGGWDERLATNQDYDLNRRMSALGQVWFEARLRSGYIPRATFGELWRQYERFGRWKVRYWRTTGDRPQPRQVLLLVGPPAGGGCTALSLRHKPRRTLAALIVAMALGEVRGASEPAATPAGHASAVLASIAVATGWSLGAWRELLRPTT